MAAPSVAYSVGPEHARRMGFGAGNGGVTQRRKDAETQRIGLGKSVATRSGGRGRNGIAHDL